MAFVEAMKEEETFTYIYIAQFINGAFHDKSPRQVDFERYQISM